MHRMALAIACQARNVMINKCKPYRRIVAQGTQITHQLLHRPLSDMLAYMYMNMYILIKLNYSMMVLYNTSIFEYLYDLRGQEVTGLIRYVVCKLLI